MIASLTYTSAQNGLFQNNTGFSVVECSRNADGNLRKQLEIMSGYTPLFPHYSPDAWRNPVNYACRKVTVAGKTYYVLSRICFNGVDYTKRSNKLASHIAISVEEIPRFASGPASIFDEPGLFRDASWEIKPSYVDDVRLSDRGSKPAICHAWRRVTGDAGHAGSFVERYLTNPKRTVYFIFDPAKSEENLRLVQEAMLLLTPELRWSVTFSTYFTENVAGVGCQWRFCPIGSEILISAKRNLVSNLIIDLCSSQPPAEGGELVNLARTGIPSLPPNAPLEQSTAPLSVKMVNMSQETGFINKNYSASERAVPYPISGNEGSQEGVKGYKFLLSLLCVIAIVSGSLIWSNGNRRVQKTQECAKQQLNELFDIMLFYMDAQRDALEKSAETPLPDLPEECENPNAFQKLMDSFEKELSSIQKYLKDKSSESSDAIMGMLRHTQEIKSKNEKLLHLLEEWQKKAKEKSDAKKMISKYNDDCDRLKAISDKEIKKVTFPRRPEAHSDLPDIIQKLKENIMKCETLNNQLIAVIPNPKEITEKSITPSSSNGKAIDEKKPMKENNTIGDKKEMDEKESSTEEKVHKTSTSEGSKEKEKTPSTTPTPEKATDEKQVPAKEADEIPGQEEKKSVPQNMPTGTNDEKPTRNDKKPTKNDKKPNKNDEKPNKNDEKPNKNDEKPNKNDEKPNKNDEKPTEKTEKSKVDQPSWGSWKSK